MSSEIYSVSADTANGLVHQPLLISEIINSSISTTLFGINVLGDVLTIVFISSISGPEKTTLDAVIAAHLGSPIDCSIEEVLKTNTIVAIGPSGVDVEQINITGNIITPIDGTGAIQGMIIDADINTIINIDDNEIKTGAAINTTKLANGTITNAEFQQLNGILSSVVGISDTQTLTNKTLTSPVISSISNGGTLTLPTTSLTLVGRVPAASIDKGIVTFSGVGGLTIQGAGVRHYGALATDPVSPTPQAGDEYYNTAINHKMCYDGLRNKWLSITGFMDGCGFNGNVNANSFYRRWNGMTLSPTLGAVIPKGTIIWIGYTNNNTVTHTLEVLVNGVVVAELNSGGFASASSDTINADFNTGNISFRNKAGSSTTNNLQSAVYFKLRA